MLLSTEDIKGITDQRDGKPGGRVRLTVEPLGVVLCRAERGQDAQASVNGRIASREIHGRGGIELPAGREQGCGVVLGAVGAASHAADLIMDLGQVTQLGVRTREESQRSPMKPL